MKSHKRQWIERWIPYDKDIAEQHLLEAIEKDKEPIKDWPTEEDANKMQDDFFYSDAPYEGTIWMNGFNAAINWLKTRFDEKDNPEQFSREDMKEAFENGNVLGWHRNEFKTFDKWLKEYLNSPEYLKAKS